jgi:nucleoid-associated protein YgaU
MTRFERESDSEILGRRVTALLDAPPGGGRDGEAEPEVTDRMYVVAEGDTLTSIARKFYGRASERWRILAANRRVIRDPYFVLPGWRLRIPM